MIDAEYIEEDAIIKCERMLVAPHPPEAEPDKITWLLGEVIPYIRGKYGMGFDSESIRREVIRHIQAR